LLTATQLAQYQFGRGTGYSYATLRSVHISAPARGSRAARQHAGTGQVAADGDEGTPSRVHYSEKRDAPSWPISESDILPGMDRTRLTAVERHGHWTVCIAWPNGRNTYFGKYTEREACDWIKEHRWLSAKTIEEKDLVPRGRPSKDDNRKRSVRRRMA
jgi:hypothetical protein